MIIFRLLALQMYAIPHIEGALSRRNDILETSLIQREASNRLDRYDRTNDQRSRMEKACREDPSWPFCRYIKLRDQIDSRTTWACYDDPSLCRHEQEVPKELNVDTKYSVLQAQDMNDPTSSDMIVAGNDEESRSPSISPIANAASQPSASMNPTITPTSGNEIAKSSEPSGSEVLGDRNTNPSTSPVAYAESTYPISTSISAGEMEESSQPSMVPVDLLPTDQNLNPNNSSSSPATLATPQLSPSMAPVAIPTDELGHTIEPSHESMSNIFLNDQPSPPSNPSSSPDIPSAGTPSTIPTNLIFLPPSPPAYSASLDSSSPTWYERTETPSNGSNTSRGMQGNRLAYLAISIAASISIFGCIGLICIGFLKKRQRKNQVGVSKSPSFLLIEPENAVSSETHSTTKISPTSGENVYHQADHSPLDNASHSLTRAPSVSDDRVCTNVV